MKHINKTSRQWCGWIWSKAFHLHLRPVITAILAFGCYSRALPPIIFVYWSMFLVSVAGALVLSKFVRVVEKAIAPDLD